MSHEEEVSKWGAGSQLLCPRACWALGTAGRALPHGGPLHRWAHEVQGLGGRYRGVIRQLVQGHTRPCQWRGGSEPWPLLAPDQGGAPALRPLEGDTWQSGSPRPSSGLVQAAENRHGQLLPGALASADPSVGREEGPGSCAPHSGPAMTRRVLAVLGAPRGLGTNTLTPQTSRPAARPPGTEGSSTRGESAGRVCSGQTRSRPLRSSALPEPGRSTDVSFKQLSDH